MRHVATKENPADWLTKWLSGSQLEMAIEYATNGREAVKETAPGVKLVAEAALQIAIERALAAL